MFKNILILLTIFSFSSSHAEENENFCSIHPFGLAENDTTNIKKVKVATSLPVLKPKKILIFEKVKEKIEFGIVSRDIDSHLTIDGVKLVTGDRVLIKDEQNKVINGIYTYYKIWEKVNWFLIRSWDGKSQKYLNYYSIISVSHGKKNKDTRWIIEMEPEDNLKIDESEINFIPLISIQ